MHPFASIGIVFFGCCTNMFFLESIVKFDPGSGNLVTFVQFVFISIEGFIFTADFGRKKSHIPIKEYAMMVVVFFSVQISNNYALNFNISVPLHMIYRSGSLMANLVLAVVILKRSYSWSKYAGVLLITAGIVICTLKSAASLDSKHNQSDESQLLWWLVGVFLLTFALFMSARLGIFQEQLAKKYGKFPRETLFYCHALPLPSFVLLSGDIYAHYIKLSNSEPVEVPLVGVQVPWMLLVLLMNLIVQYVCIRGVYILTTEYSSLIVTLILTLRKFVSLIVSIIYFRNPFTVYHWFGTAMVFCGTLIFVGAFDALTGTKEEKAKDD